MSDPKEYIPFRDHIHEHGERMRAIVLQHAQSVGVGCGDPGCKYPAFWEGLTDEQLEGAAIVMIRFAHDMGEDQKANATKYTDLVLHLTVEQLRRDGEVLNWECLSEGAAAE